ncbi:MAG TPA: hypothetical protein VF712_03780 [Thermoleophilaceae bacterium]|jgi:DNA-directed RNA polymerase specialized sigma24 family protein
MVPGDEAVAGRPGDDAARASIATALDACDEEAFAALVERYHGRLLRLARAVQADDAAARGAVRAAWLEALRERVPPDPFPSLTAWLFYLTFRELRLVAAAPTPDGGPGVDRAAFEPEDDRWEGWWLDDAMPEPWSEERDAASLRRAALKESLRGLHPHAAALLVLNDAEGLDARELTAALGLPRETQIALLHDARTKLREALDERAGAPAS